MGDAALALPVAAAPPGEPEAVGVEPRGVVVAAAPPVVAAGVVADVEAVWRAEEKCQSLVVLYEGGC
jgi:hypothetical protein